MNVRIKYEMTWRAGVWFEDRLQMNNYQIILDLTTISNDQEEHIVCLNRVKHFVYTELDSTVFINQSDKAAAKALTNAGINITPLPEDPIDQVVGMILFNKLNAIMEGRVVVRAFDICSDLGDNIHYLHSDSELLNIDFGTGWWDDAGPTHNNFKLPDQKNVVRLTRTSTWKDFDLDWYSESDNEVDSAAINTILKFNKDED